MQRIEFSLKQKRQELDAVNSQNEREERELLVRRNLESKLLGDIVEEYDSSQEVKQRELEALKREKAQMKEKVEKLEKKMQSLTFKKKCKLEVDIEWERKRNIMKLETEEQVSAVQFLVSFWKIQHLRKKRLRRRRRRRNKPG